MAKPDGEILVVPGSCFGTYSKRGTYVVAWSSPTRDLD